jgi:hypothetical protein
LFFTSILLIKGKQKGGVFPLQEKYMSRTLSPFHIYETVPPNVRHTAAMQ